MGGICKCGAKRCTGRIWKADPDDDDEDEDGSRARDSDMDS
jgi:hypothetical protein